MKNKFLTFIIAVSMALMTTSCNKISTLISIIGTWDSVQMSYIDNGKTITAPLEGITYVFHSDFTMEYSMKTSQSSSLEYGGTWDLDNEDLTVEVDYGSVKEKNTYKVVGVTSSSLILKGSLFSTESSSASGTVTFKRR